MKALSTICRSQSVNHCTNFKSCKLHIVTYIEESCKDVGWLCYPVKTKITHGRLSTKYHARSAGNQSRQRTGHGRYSQALLAIIIQVSYGHILIENVLHSSWSVQAYKTCCGVTNAEFCRSRFSGLNMTSLHEKTIKLSMPETT